MHRSPSILFAIVLTALIVGLIIERNITPGQSSAYHEAAQQFGEINQKTTPPQPFYFDGCTLFPDQIGSTSFLSACLEHDIAYWYGGSSQERKTADRKFKLDIANSGPAGPWLQWPMYGAVRIFGDTLILRQFNANWGFGHNL